MSDKLQDIDIIIGQTIKKFEFNKYCVALFTEDKIYDVLVYDESYGCNDSHAYFGNIKLNNIIGEKIAKAYHKGMSSDGVELHLETEDGSRGEIEIIHEHNGYYGFSYEVVERK